MQIVSIYLAIYSDRLAAYLPAEVVPAVENAGFPASNIPALFEAMTNGTAAAIEGLPGMDDNVLGAYGLALKVAYGRAFRIVYLSTLGFFAMGMFASFFVREVTDLLTGFVNKTLHKPLVLKKGEEQT